ncbi:MAG: membrane lipoprotein lipid attachment site-containing protein, partial [Bacteroidales bacterium]|nr:membrane lipoprotein lipid attachment site-containing protein [Bacteroidales bacterium]
MKKILFALTVFALLVASCNLDEKPKGVLDKDDAILSVEDVEGWANYEYVYYRAYTAGSYVYIPEIAADFWNPMIDYGNRNG